MAFEKQVLVRLSKEQYAKLQRRCFEEDIPEQEVIRNFIDNLESPEDCKKQLEKHKNIVILYEKRLENHKKSENLDEKKAKKEQKSENLKAKIDKKKGAIQNKIWQKLTQRFGIDLNLPENRKEAKFKEILQYLDEITEGITYKKNIRDSLENAIKRYILNMK